MAIRNLFLSVFLVLSFVNIVLSGSDDCVYTVYVRTSTILKSGTDSIISLRLYDKHGYGVNIPNLVTWGGLMGPGHNYFENGNLDIFSGRGACLKGPVCAMNLTSDDSGPHSSWYVNYVEVTATGVHGRCNQQLFTVEQWLSHKVWPFETTVIQDNCSSDYHGGQRRGRRDNRLIKSVTPGL